ncbi:MAG: ubiquitin-like small modifier protein 1 [Anaerolineaceae bacterium]
MKVNFYATLRQMAGQKTVELDLPTGATLRDALAAVLGVCPGIRPHLVDSQGELRGHIHLLLDRQDVHFLPQSMDTPVQPESEVDVYPPIGGG